MIRVIPESITLPCFLCQLKAGLGEGFTTFLRPFCLLSLVRDRTKKIIGSQESNPRVSFIERLSSHQGKISKTSSLCSSNYHT